MAIPEADAAIRIQAVQRGRTDRRACRLHSLGRRVCRHYRSHSSPVADGRAEEGSNDALGMLDGAVPRLDGILLKQSGFVYQQRAVRVDNLQFKCPARPRVPEPRDRAGTVRPHALAPEIMHVHACAVCVWLCTGRRRVAAWRSQVHRFS